MHNRDKTLPTRNPAGQTGTKLSQQAAPMDPPGTKLSQHTTKRLYQAISRLQGELLHAYGRGKPSRENFVPHTGPPPGQNSPHTKPRRAKPVQNSPSRQPRWTHPGQNSPNTPQNGYTKPFLACRENFFTPTAEASRAGRTLYRTQDHLRDKTLPTRNPAGQTGIKLSQQAAPMDPPGTKLSQHETPAVVSRIVV